VERLARGLSYVDDERFDILILLFLPRERSGRWHRESVVGGDEHVRAGADDECVSVGADAGIDHRTVDGRRELREHEAEPEGGRSGVTAGRSWATSISSASVWRRITPFIAAGYGEPKSEASVIMSDQRSG